MSVIFCPPLLVLPPSACAPTFELNPVKKQLLGARNGRVVIECRPRAAPRPRFTWTKGKELLYNNSRYRPQNAH